MKIKRYFCDQHYVEAGFSLDPKGRWVRYEDHNAVITKQQAEMDGLRSALSLVLEARTFYSGVQKKNNVPIYLSVKEWDSLSELLSKA